MPIWNTTQHKFTYIMACNIIESIFVVFWILRYRRKINIALIYL